MIAIQAAPPFNWESVRSSDEDTLRSSIQKNPEMQINTLFQELIACPTLPSGANTTSVKKLAEAMKEFRLPIPLLHRLFKAAKKKGLLNTTETTQLLANQNKFEVKLEEVLDQWGQEGKKPSQSRDSDLLLKLEDDVIKLVCQGKELPSDHPRAVLFLILCKHFKTPDQYRWLRKTLDEILKSKNDYLDEKDPNTELTPFCYFAKNGGDFNKLFQNIDDDLLQAIAAEQLGVTPESYELNPAEKTIIALYDEEIRKYWLAAKDLSFLMGPALIAFSQFVDKEICTNDPATVGIYILDLLPSIEKLTLIQQEEFLENLSPYSKGLIADSYIDKLNNFTEEKTYIVSHLQAISEHLPGDKKNDLDPLFQLSVPIVKHIPENKVERTLTEIIRKLDYIFIWTGDLSLRSAARVLKTCQKDILTRKNRVSYKDDCIEILADSSTKLKYDLVRKQVQHLTKNSSLQVDQLNFDWDELVATIFQDFAPNPKSIKKSLKKRLNSYLEKNQINTIYDLIPSLKKKKTRQKAVLL